MYPAPYRTEAFLDSLIFRLFLLRYAESIPAICECCFVLILSSVDAHKGYVKVKLFTFCIVQLVELRRWQR
jgi:hypothetical protein